VSCEAQSWPQAGGRPALRHPGPPQMGLSFWHTWSHAAGHGAEVCPSTQDTHFVRPAVAEVQLLAVKWLLLPKNSPSLCEPRWLAVCRTKADEHPIEPPHKNNKFQLSRPHALLLHFAVRLAVRRTQPLRKMLQRVLLIRLATSCTVAKTPKKKDRRTTRIPKKQETQKVRCYAGSSNLDACAGYHLTETEKLASPLKQVTHTPSFQTACLP